MDHQHEHNQQQGRQQRSSPAPAPIAPNPNGMATSSGGNNGQGTMGVHHNHGMLMGLMTNPALAAAAAGSSLFPPAALLTNPGAFFAMPDVFASANGMSGVGGSHQAAPTIHGHFQQQQQQQQQQAAAGMAAPLHRMQQSSGGNGTATVYTDAMGNQVQHIQSGQQYIPQMQMSNPTGSSLMFPGGPNQGSSSIRAHLAAAAAAAEAVGDNDNDDSLDGQDRKRTKDLSSSERAKQNRDRNREHARSTRLRKKAYVHKLKDLVEGLHAERTEEVRQRRVAIQHLAEMQNVRRAVTISFLQCHSNYERDRRKWCTILDDDVWLKQPVTHYRCFRRSEIEEECRMSRGVDAVIADAASVAAMIEGIGSRSTRWMQIKREDFFLKEEERTGTKILPSNVVRQSGRFQHAVSSLSSSSGNSSNTGGASSGEDSKPSKQTNAQMLPGSSSPPNGDKSSSNKESGVFHDYHAKPLPDPKLQGPERGSSPSEDSPEESNNSSADDTKRVSTDSSSGDDSADVMKEPRPSKRQKSDHSKNIQGAAPTAGAAAAASNSYLPKNIAKKGGISHNIRPFATQLSEPLPHQNGSARLAVAPAVVLPPFAGLGKRGRPNDPPPTAAGTDMLPDAPPDRISSQGQESNDVTRSGGSGSSNGGVEGGPAMISGDVETSSSNSSNNRSQIRGYYHVNEDDMILMDDILMCPFVFRTQDAVQCGALAECIMPGMLRASFTKHNKLKSLEMTYDAMGFMQQLERASGCGMTAQIIPGSLEMALSLSAPEARAITLAKPPFQIICVNEPWTRLTKYTQVEVEGMELLKVLEGEAIEDQPPSVPYDLEGVSKGNCTCTTRLHYDKSGEQFVDFICSYPLTNTNDEITHLLHISKKLPPFEDSIEELQEDDSGMEEVQ